jgi:hypothetical protein
MRGSRLARGYGLVRGFGLVIGGLLIAQVVAATPRDAESGPDMEFLEYLGGWQGEDSPWVDPLYVEDDPSIVFDPQADPRPESGKRTTGQQRERRSSRPGQEPAPYPDDEAPPKKRGQ